MISLKRRGAKKKKNEGGFQNEKLVKALSTIEKNGFFKGSNA